MLGSNFVFQLVNLSSYKASCKPKELQILHQKYLNWLFRLEFEKAIAMLDFSTFNLSKCNISCKKNIFKCRTKIALFGYFCAGARKS